MTRRYGGGGGGDEENGKCDTGNIIKKKEEKCIHQYCIVLPKVLEGRSDLILTKKKKKLL